MTPVQGVRTGDQPVAEGFPDPFEQRTAFVEDPVAAQQLLGQRRITDRHRGDRPEPDAHQISVRGQGTQERQRVAQQRHHVPEQRQTMRYGGDRGRECHGDSHDWRRTPEK
ncbi:hypothetical protein [Nocardia tengchongensis]|uniref:hypothetical protein n=1 Tax=Nocardia tengchongensis TaxID=2055889 RepID=UPI0036A21951